MLRGLSAMRGRWFGYPRLTFGPYFFVRFADKIPPDCAQACFVSPEQEEGQLGDQPWILPGGRSHPSVGCPFLFHNNSPSKLKESGMAFNSDGMPVTHVAHLLQEASAKTGFTPDEIEALVNSDLATEHLLEYITAVVSKRMN
jgi:hypothetical protein